MKSRMCENCIKYKTIYCPNSEECLSREDKPFYEDKYTILTKVEVLVETLKDYIEELQTLKIQISAREEVCNRLENNWNKLKEYLINDINDRNGTKIAEYEEGNRVSETISPIYTLMEDKSKTMKEVLDKMLELERGVSDDNN